MTRAVFAPGLVLLAATGCGDVVTATATVTIERTGPGTGELQASYGALDCSGTACTLEVPVGATTTLTPKPAEGSLFDGWTGGECEGKSGCQITVDNDMSLSAGFKLGRVLVTVQKSGSGVARITSTPPGINCGETCVGEFDYGTMVTLTTTVTPATGTSFQGWSGAGCSGTGDCTLMATDAVTATAAFGCDPGTATFNYTGGLQYLQLPRCATKVTIDAYGAQGGAGMGKAGGLGARITGTVSVTEGSALTILVG